MILTLPIRTDAHANTGKSNACIVKRPGEDRGTPWGIIRNVRERCPHACDLCPLPIHEGACVNNPRFMDASGNVCGAYGFAKSMGVACTFGPQLTLSWGLIDHIYQTNEVQANCPNACKNCMLEPWPHGPGKLSCADDPSANCPEVVGDGDCVEAAFDSKVKNQRDIALIAWSLFWIPENKRV